MARIKPKNYITGTMTLTDGTFTQETISVPFPALQPGAFGISPNQLVMLHLKNLIIETGYNADTFDTIADQLTITITPNSETSHPNITDNDCLFKYAQTTAIASAATNDFGMQYHIKKWKLEDVYISKPQFYMQVTFDSTATTLYYKIEYEMISISATQAGIEAIRRGYATS